jgi:carboxynorspermidine decarboxylase
VTAANFRPDLLDGLSGLHFHTLCEQNADDLISTLNAAEERFGEYFHRMEWVNFGGGHHITRRDYDVDALISCITRFRQKYGVRVYLEPGEAVALDAGFLVSTVLDFVENGIVTAILDTSAACHMPDVLEAPYRPEILGAGQPGSGRQPGSGQPEEKPFTYRLAGPTCLAGDVIGDYSFDRKLEVGDKLVFTDMAHYTMVKNNTFNGMRLPSIALARTGAAELVRGFEYEDFKMRLS